MKTILVLRHAKSDWSVAYGTDEHRPLSKRGRRACGIVGQYFASLELEPDAIIASTAVRAHDTAQRVVAAAGWTCKVEEDPRLYEASVEDVLAVVRKCEDAIETLMLVGHEPTSSSLARALLGGGMIRFPTAAVLRVDLPITDWASVRPGAGVLRWMVIPRQLEKMYEG